MNDREPPGYDDWFDEPEPPTLESGRGGRASYDIPAETEEDVWVLPEDEPRRQRKPANGEIVLFGVALTKNQVAILALAALALFIAILDVAGAFSGSSGKATTSLSTPVSTTQPGTTTTAPPTTDLPSAASLPLQLNDKGKDVKLLQKALIQLQFLHGTADGVFGPATQTAVEDFQSANGVAVDGVFGAQSLAKLKQALGG